MENPLLDIYTLGNNEYIPFDKIKDEHFEPAFEIAFKNAKEQLDTIVDNHDEATFENTIEALEHTGEQLNAIVTILTNYKSANTNSEIERISEIMMPRVADWANTIFHNEKLFAKVKSLHDAKLNLDIEQQRLLQVTYDSFVRSGALLSSHDKEKLNAIDQEIESLRQVFSKNLLKATNDYVLVIDNEKDLAGLPDRVKDSAKAEAIERGMNDKWVFTLQYPSYAPFMEHADNENLRKQLSVAVSSRAMSGENNNQPVILRTIVLKEQKAEILGYESYADFMLDNRMAKTISTVNSFFEKLYAAAKPKADADYGELVTCKAVKNGTPLESWDVSYYAEKVKQEKYNFSEEELRPYFELDNVFEGLFEHARLLYGLKFEKKTDIPVYHQDMTVFEVSDADGRYIGTMYFDLFPRESKRGGAWIDALRMQHRKNGSDVRSQALIVASLTKPTETTPSLLSAWDTITLFHEFGHGMHVLLSECTYASLAGFNALWDFVELPSQFMDTFIRQKDSLKMVGKHYKEGSTIPDEILDKYIASKKFMAGWGVMSQLSYAVLDMRWHDGTAHGITSVEEFEALVRKPYRFFNPIPGTSYSANFSHIFSGGYDAGYYSYLWAEVLATDAFEYFKNNGLFNKDIALSFRENVLSRGNTEEPMILYKRFRGQEPDPQSLFRVKGLL